MKRIPLTRGQFVLVDDEDFECLNQFKWYALWSEHTESFYALRRDIKGETRYMHCLIMNTPRGMVCDHINHNTLDNQKKNLRNCTRQHNAQNQKLRKDNKVGEKNITFVKGKFILTISKRFSALEDAVAVRDKIGKELHGEFFNNGK